MPRIKPHVKDLYRTEIGSVSRKGYLRLDMNESVSGLPPQFIRRALAGVGPDIIARYPEYKSLQAKIARHNGLKPGNICLANGSDAAIKYIFDAFISSKDKVLLTEPTFAMYPVYCSMFSVRPVIVKYDSVRAFPLERFLNKISPAIKMAVIVNPHNPTGSVLSERDLIRIIQKARDNNVLVLVDEAYFYFCRRTVIKEVKRYRNLIVLRTFSKLCGMAGLRIGYAAAAPGIIEGLRNVRPSFDINSIGILFAERLLDAPGLLRKLTGEVDKGKGYLVKQLCRARIEHVAGEANFVLIRCDGKTAELKERLAQKKVLVAAGFKQDFLKSFIRVTAGDRRSMQSFWEVFYPIWRQYEKRRIS